MKTLSASQESYCLFNIDVAQKKMAKHYSSGKSTHPDMWCSAWHPANLFTAFEGSTDDSEVPYHGIIRGASRNSRPALASVEGLVPLGLWG